MAAAGVISCFDLPSHLEAAEPPEARGLARDEVRLLVSDIAREAIEHARFHDLPQWLSPGDVLVVNTSGTLPAALPVVAVDRVDRGRTPARISQGNVYDLHLSTRLSDSTWVVELRRPDAFASSPSSDAYSGMRFELPGGARASLIAPHRPTSGPRSSARLWKAHVSLPASPAEYLSRYGFPIRYRYVPEPWPIAMYQTVFATEAGSAEMPSAGRPFTPRSSRGWSRAACNSHRCCSTLASPASRTTNLHTRSSIASPPKRPRSSTPPVSPAAASSRSGRR